MLNLDFKLYKGKTQDRSFTFRSDDGTYMDLSDCTVVLDVHNIIDGSILNSIVGTIDEEIASVSFIFNSTILTWNGSNEYYIVKKKVGEQDMVLLRGNVILEEYSPFSNTIDSYLLSELPLGFVPSVDFTNQKIRYWRLFLQSAFDIPDSLLNIDSAWPELVNILIAKLVTHDVLLSSIRGNLITAFGENITTSDTSNGMGMDVKSIETGPSKVEFHPVGETMLQLLKSTTTSNNILYQLAQDICGLSSKLAVKLPMCKAENLVIPFQIGKKTTIPLNFNKSVSRG